jgi:hypothetical protein
MSSGRDTEDTTITVPIEPLGTAGSPHGGGGEHHGAAAAHEPDVVPARPIVIGSIVLLLLLVLGYLIPTALEHALMDREARLTPPANPLAEKQGARLPPAPRLQVNPARDIVEHRRAEDRVLSSYGWIDAEKGIARIPIDRAMALVAERGIPAPSVAPSAPAPAPVEEGAP